MLVTAVILGIVGPLMVFGACSAALGRKPHDERALQADGRVTALEEGGSGEFPVVSFTPEGADTAVTFSSSFTTNNYKIGQTLRVYYESGDPGSATLMSPGDSRSMAMTLAMGGSLRRALLVARGS